MKGRLEVTIKKGYRDVVAENFKKKVTEELGITIVDVHFVEAYNLTGDFTEEELEKLGKEVFTDSIIQEPNTKATFQKHWRIEIGLLPGVTDNIGNTAMQAIKDSLGREIDVFYSRVYAFSGNLDQDQCNRIAKLLHNPIIEKYRLHYPAGIPEPYLPKVVLKHEPKVEKISLHMSIARWESLVKQRLLALNAEEFKAIKQYFKSEKVIQQRKKVGLDTQITDVELEALAQTWSEHCKHKIFNAHISYKEGEEAHAINSLFNTFIKGATEQSRKPYIVSVFKDNGGIIKFNHEYDIAIKVETHNAPSALDPYGGALTGVLGVQRDVLGTGLGANPIANMDMLCFGYLDEKEVPDNVLHPKVIYDGVTKGIEHGGNKMGIPTVNGSIIFDKCYTARPLVYCGTVGIMPSKVNNRKSSEKIIKPGYLAVMVGGRVGKDGIHGATFSSQQIDETTPQSVVQIGDPITQKKTLDFVLESRDGGLYEAITDNGAGGLSSSIGELAQFSGGCEMYLEKVPLKYSGLDPWEILVSESQERMSLAVPPENLDSLRELAKKHDVEITVVGKFTGSRKFHIFYNNNTVAYLDMKFLHEGVPQLKLEAEWKKLEYPDPKIPEEAHGKVLKKLLASPNITTKEGVIRRYDHEVKGESVIKPIMRGPNDAAVIKPSSDSNEGIVISHGICSKYVQDSYDMAAMAFDEAVRNAIAVGCRFGYMAALDNFSWPDSVHSEKTPDGKYKLAQLVRSCIALYDISTCYGIPLVSGKDSMKNDYYGKDGKSSILPTLLMTTTGKIGDIRKAVSSDFKKTGDIVYVLGTTKDELGGSEYYRLYGGVGNNIPKVKADENAKLYKALSFAMEEGLVESCHDMSDGGLAVCFAECAIGGNVGADLDVSIIASETEKEEAYLFSESAGRFIVTVKPDKIERFDYLLRDTVCKKAGRIRGDKRLVIRRENDLLINELVRDLKIEYEKGVE